MSAENGGALEGRPGPTPLKCNKRSACSRAQISESPSVIGRPAASVLSAPLGREVGIVSDTCSLWSALSLPCPRWAEWGLGSLGLGSLICVCGGSDY